MHIFLGKNERDIIYKEIGKKGKKFMHFRTCYKVKHILTFEVSVKEVDANTERERGCVIPYLYLWMMMTHPPPFFTPLSSLPLCIKKERDDNHNPIDHRPNTQCNEW